MLGKCVYAINILVFPILIAVSSGQAFAIAINGTITGTVTGLSQRSETGEEAPFGFNIGNLSTLSPEAVGLPVTVNYQYDTANAPLGSLTSAPTGSGSCTVTSGRCIYDTDRSIENQFFSAEITFNNTTFSITNPALLANSGLYESTIAIENEFNPRLPNIVRDHIDFRLENVSSQTNNGVTRTVRTDFNTNIFRNAAEGLTSDLSLTQVIDWDFARDGVATSPEESFPREALFSFTDSQAPSQFGNGSNDIILGASISFNIDTWQQSAASAVGTTPENPLLPSSESGGVFIFDAAVNSNDFIFIDPLIAVGYDYETGSGDPNFASVLLPDIGDGIYDLILFDQNDNPFDTGTDILAGVAFDFTAIDPLGISKFGIRGIELSAALDPNDPSAFVTGLRFFDNGRFTGTMTPVSVFVQALEPGTAAIIGVGLVGLGFAARQRRNTI